MKLGDAVELLEEVREFDDSMYAYNPAYMEALNLVISAVKELGKDRWTPVTEALPEEDGEYLVTYESGYAEDYCTVYLNTDEHKYIYATGETVPLD